MAPAPILVVGSSGRIAAEALAYAGLRVDVLDCFGDADTRRVAHHVNLIHTSAHAPFTPDPAALVPLVKDWMARHPAGSILTTSGFESSPDTLQELSQIGPVWGNRAETLMRSKDPWKFARCCHHAGLNTPDLLEPIDQASRNQWLKKQIGGSGGLHIQTLSWNEARKLKAPWYAQQHIEGIALSALFLCAQAVSVLSFHQQYLAPSPAYPYRFGGVIAEADIPARARELLTYACVALSQELDLIGLNGLDAIWDGRDLWILEINPRPPASLALYPLDLLAQLFVAHLLSFFNQRGEETLFGSRLPSFPAALKYPAFLPGDLSSLLATQHNLLNRGMAIVYASSLLLIPADFRFPPGCHDLPILPRSFQAGEPICSVVASDGGLGKLRAQVKALRECLNPVAGEDLLCSL